MTKFVVECDEAGSTFAYLESDKLFDRVDRQRSGLERVPLERLRENCRIDNGQYVVVDLDDPPADEGVEKPPLGLMPRQFWLEDRVKQIVEAVGRRNGVDVPVSWIEELAGICEELRPGS